ncbi:MAG: 2-dehydro-3-deoxyphosphooctonate aldolase [Alphaproteobacteria bacterium MarineAlpha9_Bin2]|nr:MAG: 2-dehydro-3-deoxyphosphooctonate aldolase [Alphaproteobacteria bacterium MarineAlpha9_Bin2]
MNKGNMVKVSHLNISNNLPFTLIAGPCVIESKDHALETAQKIASITKKLNIQFIYKSSFDKANRTSLNSERGPGLNLSLEIFDAIKSTIGCPVITDVHEISQLELISKVVDIIQIPAFLCRQTDLLIEAAKTNKPVMVKKGQFLAPWDIKNVIDKLSENGNGGVLVCERGVSFGYNTLVSDFRSLPIMKSFGCPVVYDATHSVQQPGGMGDKSGGQREFVPILAKAAVSIGVAALFMETHQDPDNAPSDGPNMLHLDDLEKLLSTLKKIDKIAKEDA